MGGKGRDVLLSRPTCPGRWPQNRRIITAAKVLLKEQEVQAPHQAAQSGDPTPGDKPPEHLALKANRACIWQSQKAIGNIDSVVKGAYKISLDDPGRSSNLKQAKIIPFGWTWRASQRWRRQLGLTLGTQMLAAAIFESSFYHRDIGAGKHHFGALPLWCSPADHLVGPCPRKIPGQAASIMGT